MLRGGIAVVGSIDSSGCAGINQDIVVASRLGFRLQTCIGAVTIQDKEKGVEQIHPIAPDMFVRNLRKVLHDASLRHLKIGALCNAEQIDALVQELTLARGYLVVLDPVINPSRGKAFLDEEALASLRILVMSTDFTCPNLPELYALAAKSPESDPEIRQLAAEYSRMAGTRLLVKGGHGEQDGVEDLFADHGKVVTLQHPRQDWAFARGTGCALAMAFTCFLALNNPAFEAYQLATEWVVNFFNEQNGIRI
ncbi:MAG: bifunctional hydroxymethylpyrimidine kinase/phosphomethylpyrimidine kinase [Candidatus Cloacimonetes bacterium]|nr:bifunctional hydroxymethylpyrimidine kinase/phosphomethylpyrimidine kinase [Candidatus Cloacimonadota bacterium]